MTQIYEGMFLLDNQVVREGWSDAKALVTSTLEKHGGKILSARRWDERRLAYPIKSSLRATYLLTYYELPPEGIAGMRLDFDLSEKVMRYLHLCVDAVPEGEADLAAAENADDFVVPTPPEDDAPDVEEQPEGEPEAAKKAEEKSSDAPADAAEAPADKPADSEKSAEAPAAPAGDASANTETADTAKES